VNEEEFEPEQIEEESVEPDSGDEKSSSLADWKNPPTVNQLKRDVNDAEVDFNAHVSDVKKWLDVRDAKLKVKVPKGKSKVSPKLIRRHNEWRYASLEEPFLSTDDLFNVEPETHADKEGARQNSLILNKQINKDMDKVHIVNTLIRTLVDEGCAIMRVGWESVEEEMEQDVIVATESVDADGSPIVIQTIETESVTELVVNRPTIEICDYDKVMLDPTCNGQIEKANFIVYQFKTSKSQLIIDPKYSNIDKIVDDGTSNALAYADDDIINSTFKFEDEARKELLATEYWGNWDIHGDGTTVPIVATYIGSTMIRLEENPFPDKKPPFVKIVFIPKRNDVYGGEPDAVFTEDNQDIIGATTRGMIDLMAKSANAQQGISANALDTAQKLKFDRGEDYVFNPDVDPTKAFYMGSYPEIPQSAITMIEMQNADAESLTGVKAFSGGISGQSLGSTATGVRSAMDATTKRELGFLRRISKGFEEVGKKIVAMNAILLEDEEIIKISDDEEVVISRDALAGNYDLTISISTPEADNEKAQDLGFMLQTIGNNMDQELRGIILSEIAELKDMPGLAKKIKDFKPQPNPDDEKIKQLQIQLLEAQLKNEVAKGTENEADTELKYAKAETEKAKTRNLESNSDNQDLKYLQEANGTKHKENLEMEDKKLANELDKKGADSLLSPDTPSRGLKHRMPDTSGDNVFAKDMPQLENTLGMDYPSENLDDAMSTTP